MISCIHEVPALLVNILRLIENSWKSQTLPLSRKILSSVWGDSCTSVSPRPRSKAYMLLTEPFNPCLTTQPKGWS
ncbi:hypothetical protein GOP47_0030218 [Adiantum capillus-veneris]|nr:hypothetical protein GOP47_0030218 [Adiantum capillus-veneris]